MTPPARATTALPSRPSAQAGTGRLGTEELFVRWQQRGDQRAREELVERFLPLARKLARRYSGAREPFEDLMQVASLGLVKAVDRFDTARGTAFSSFAVPTILGELKRYFRDLGWSVHVPRGAQERALKVEEAQQRLTARTGRPPTVPQLAEYLELSIEEVLDSLETARAHHSVSLDAPHDDGEGETGTLVDAFGELDERFQLVDAKVTIGVAARHLSARERRVLLLRFVEDLTQTQIAELIGVSQMQVSRILRRALARLSELANTEARVAA
ncbi:MAG: SigB/SigF/SigG family RNA polymerase sigma factor [Solirubrobacterales bacterium]|nr:SigB/SigF/SigG family RNA polymerase sigma factor [Solirubrobacterales bacterium]MBV9839715.1 SigB/SigF/SigG family RNA polymerase sigma factor [Solirubrobacterales bacterium]